MGGCKFSLFKASEYLQVKYLLFGFVPTKLRGPETCSYEVWLMRVGTGCTPKDVTFSELSQNRVIG